jgi:hypothetical protein
MNARRSGCPINLTLGFQCEWLCDARTVASFQPSNHTHPDLGADALWLGATRRIRNALVRGHEIAASQRSKVESTLRFLKLVG